MYWRDHHPILCTSFTCDIEQDRQWVTCRGQLNQVDNWVMSIEQRFMCFSTIYIIHTYIHLYIPVYIYIHFYLLPVMNQGLWLVSCPGCTISYAGVNLVCRAKPQTSQCYDDAIVTSQRNLRHTRLVKDSWPTCSSIIGHQIVQIHA